MLESITAGTLAYIFLRGVYRLHQHRLVPALALLAALMDNATTWLAIGHGAVETNLLVRPFLGSPLLFLAFTVAKLAIVYSVAARRRDIGLWLAMVFIAAAAINAHNAIVKIVTG